jgi:hypothetical protein
VYTSGFPWSLPTAHGGGDDDVAGRLRLKGRITGNYATPASVQVRVRLKGPHRQGRVDIRIGEGRVPPPGVAVGAPGWRGERRWGV